MIPSEKDVVIPVGQSHVSKNIREMIKGVRVASSIVVVAYDHETQLGGMVHMALPDSRMINQIGDMPDKYVDIALPQFVDLLIEKGLSRMSVLFRIVGGSQLFNFGGGSGNLLNIGTRNAITARTILNRMGFQVDKTDTGGNKPRTVVLDMRRGTVSVTHPGEPSRYI